VPLLSDLVSPAPWHLVWGMRDPILGKALRRHERDSPQAPVTRTQAGHFLQEEVSEALAAAVEDVARRRLS
jgi:pimeloyl-ACP methyl ester carboxylesterase